jgi:hypothetical protein
MSGRMPYESGREDGNCSSTSWGPSHPHKGCHKLTELRLAVYLFDQILYGESFAICAIVGRGYHQLNVTPSPLNQGTEYLVFVFASSGAHRSAFHCNWVFDLVLLKRYNCSNAWHRTQYRERGITVASALLVHVSVVEVEKYDVISFTRMALVQIVSLTMWVVSNEM